MYITPSILRVPKGSKDFQWSVVLDYVVTASGKGQLSESLSDTIKSSEKYRDCYFSQDASVGGGVTSEFKLRRSEIIIETKKEDYI
jgi:hypothetical protein